MVALRFGAAAVLLVLSALAARKRVVIARTVKGKGVSFMEASDGWHAGHLTAEQYHAQRIEGGACTGDDLEQRFLCLLLVLGFRDTACYDRIISHRRPLCS